MSSTCWRRAWRWRERRPDGRSRASLVCGLFCGSSAGPRSLLPQYYLAYFARFADASSKALAHWQRAVLARSPFLQADLPALFPSRPEELAVFEYCLAKQPDDALAHLALGNLLAHFDRVPAAAEYEALSRLYEKSHDAELAAVARATALSGALGSAARSRLSRSRSIGRASWSARSRIVTRPRIRPARGSTRRCAMPSGIRARRGRCASRWRRAMQPSCRCCIRSASAMLS